MKTILISLALLSACFAKPNYYHSGSYNQGSTSSSQGLSPWAQTHMDEVRGMAERMRKEFNTRAYGHSGGLSSSSSYSSGSSYNFPRFMGKSQEELDLIAKQMTEQMINDMKSGQLTYSQISQPNWFEQQAAVKLEALENNDDDDDMLQQQSQNVFDGFEPGIRPDNYASEVESLNSFDQVSHVTYPPSVAVVGGKRYVTRKNCTSVTTTNTDGTVPVHSGSYFDSRNTIHRERVTNYPAQVVIPVEDNQFKRESSYGSDVQHTYYPEFNFTDTSSSSGYGGFGVGNQVYVQTPSHQAKITISHTNRTYTSRPGYDQPIVTGCRGTTVIVNGNVVYNYSQPIGTGTATCVPSGFIEAEWKRKEREHLFWLLARNMLTSEEDLTRWQQRHWQQLTRLAQEYKTTVDEIKEFQRSELKYYFNMLNSFKSDYYEDWKRKEAVRWDWLIQQNKITQDELSKWQLENHERLNELAHLYRISVDELLNWQKNELIRIQSILLDQKNEISRLQDWQMNVQNQLNNLMYEHNVTIEQLREKIRQDLSNLEMISSQYRVNTEEFRQWLEEEQRKLSMMLEERRRRPSMVVENWQRQERIRLEQIIRQYNVSMDELQERLELDRSHLQDLANDYRISIEKLKEWQRQEILRLQNEGRLYTARLEEWQKQLQDQIKSMIREHELTISELEEVIKRDRKRLEQLAQEYQISINQIENWYKNEAERLYNALKVENLVHDWRWRERQRIDDIIREHNLTVEDLKQRLVVDRLHLEELASMYNLQIRELESWYESEFKRLQDLGLIRSRIEVLANWQLEEDNRIRELISNRNFTIEDLEQRLRNDYTHLNQITQEYHISQSQILEWYQQEIDHLYKTGLLQQSESLTDWQLKENQYINELIKNYTFTIEDLVHRLEFDRQHLEELQKHYNIRIEEIKEWYRKEAESLVNRGLIQEMEKLQDWQRAQRQYIYDLMSNHELTIKELEERLFTNQMHLNQLSQDFHISIQELENWYRKEIQRLTNQGFFERIESLKSWQQLETEHIMNIIKDQKFNYEELEKYLIENREHLYSLALKYHITVTELENWYKSELLRLQQEGIINELNQWQQYVRDRLNILLKDHRWSVEELKERFEKNEDQLLELLYQYHITRQQLIDWYNKELDRLYANEEIYKKTLHWQELERANFDNLVNKYGKSLAKLQQMLLRNEALLRELALKYQISIKQLQDWYLSLINDYLSKNLIINDLVIEEEDSAWKEKERNRLLFTLDRTRMSYDEFIDFLRDDNAYNQMMANSYRINAQTLTQFQLDLLQRWVTEGNLAKLNLIVLEDWQKRERDNLYELIKQHAINNERLPSWQSTNHEKLEERAIRYGISLQTLIDWQRNELQRLYELGLHYNMTFSQLEEFRSDELLRIANVAHKPTLDQFEYQNWEYKEHLRLENLRKRHDFTDEQLWFWRRKLFLYCQGLLHLKRECIPALLLGNINKDRGDQPPNMGPNECDEDNEPGIADPNYRPAPRPPRPNLPYQQIPLVPLPSAHTRVYSYERNKTQNVVYGPNSHSSGYENTREYKEESGGKLTGSTGSTGWQSSSSRSHNSASSHQGSYSGGSSSGSNYYGHNLQRQQPRPQPGINFEVPASSSGTTNDENDYLADQQHTEDLTQQQVQDMRAELEELGQQIVQQPQYLPPNDKENLSQQRLQAHRSDRGQNPELDDLGQQTVQQVEYPTAKEIEDLNRRTHVRPSTSSTGYNSNPKVHSNNDEYPAKVQQVDPSSEVEGVQVTEKPGFWKRVFG